MTYDADTHPVEAIGYGARAVGRVKPTSTPAYIVQYLSILLAPIFFAASVYMFLGRIMRTTGHPSYSLVPNRWLTAIFVGGDNLCFVVQAAGGGILASSDSKTSSDIGKAVILTGLCLQMVIFGFFVVLAAVWRVRMNAGSSKREGSFEWNKYISMLYIVSATITVRNLFRVIEYAMGGA
ncbi:hypothetical protein AA0117_g13337 [Alternaria alternata]|uniref:RTA1-domain-containing protein n=1 Tax=Alternaria alternata TaxID=5599 RepID=A0A4Q4ML45_ALTAL|nr:hypothetical protein AA0117_g13337 [Alternaria alternata]